VGGAPPDADIIDELDGEAFFSTFKEDQLARCGEFPNCVEVRLADGSPPDGENWCAFDTTPERGTKLTEVIAEHDGVILVSVVAPGVDEEGKPACGSSAVATG
jgi:hypothetical protein